jgi:catalase
MNFTKNYGRDPNYIGTKIQPVKFMTGKQSEGAEAAQNFMATMSQDTEIHKLDRAQAAVPVSFASEVTDKDFEQATALWHIMGKQDGAQLRFVNNVAANVSGVQERFIRDEVYGMISPS